jgi:hypothetical protein
VLQEDINTRAREEDLIAEETRAQEAEEGLQNDIDTRAKEAEFGQAQTAGDLPTIVKDQAGNWQVQGFMHIVQQYYEARLHMDNDSSGPLLHILNKNIQGEAALLLNYSQDLAVPGTGYQHGLSDPAVHPGL